MIIAQVSVRLATIKGHSKMCSFTILGDPRWIHPEERKKRVIDYGRWNVGPRLVLEHAVIYADPEHPKQFYRIHP